MSQYVKFCIKTKNDKYILLDMYSRSSKVYEVISEMLPYGDGRYIDSDLYNNIITDIKNQIRSNELSIAQYEKENELIVNMNNSIGDKLEEIRSNNECIEDLKDDIQSLQYADGFYSTLWGIDDHVPIYAGIEWCPNYKEDDDAEG